MLFTRDMQPKNLTKEEWEDVKAQADEWGARFVHGFPGTEYDKETLTWDYTGNKEAVEAIGLEAGGKIYTPRLACLYR